jgi:hypothetical protein
MSCSAMSVNMFRIVTQGRAMAQAVSRRSLTAEARVRSRVSPFGICGGQSGTGAGFSRVLRFSPVNFIPPVLHYMEKRNNYHLHADVSLSFIESYAMKVCGSVGTAPPDLKSRRYINDQLRVPTALVPDNEPPVPSG